MPVRDMVLLWGRLGVFAVLCEGWRRDDVGDDGEGKVGVCTERRDQSNGLRYRMDGGNRRPADGMGLSTVAGYGTLRREEHLEHSRYWDAV
jgi:hypothetical protein